MTPTTASSAIIMPCSSCAATRGLDVLSGPIELSARELPGLEQLGRQVDALLDQAAGELRHVAGGVEVAAGDAAVVDARLLEAEQVLNRVVAAFQGRDFARSASRGGRHP